MDIAKTLMRSVARSFYDTKHVLVVDALMLHSVLPAEDLAMLLGMPTKDLRKLCGKLKEDRLLAVHSRQEIRDGMPKPINKDYYWINFYETIDAIKYRVFRLTRRVKELYKPTSEKKHYFCPKCQAQWTQLEVLDKVGPMGFECHRCGGLLEREERQDGEATGHEMQSRLMSQLGSLVKMLQDIDLQDIPNPDFDTAMTMAVPISRESNLNPLKVYQPTNTKGTAAVANRITTTAAGLDVSVITSSERTEAEQATEAKKKADLAAQNVLPVWHTTSTVTGQKTGLMAQMIGAQVNGAFTGEDEEDVKNDDDVVNDTLAAYSAAVERDKKLEAQQEEEDDETSGDDDQEFEEVAISPSSNPPMNGASTVKRERNGDASETEDSTPVTNASTPANGEADGPAPKKVKFEDTALDNELKEDSDEDDGETFEEVL